MHDLLKKDKHSKNKQVFRSLLENGNEARMNSKTVVLLFGFIRKKRKTSLQRRPLHVPDVVRNTIHVFSVGT